MNSFIITASGISIFFADTGKQVSVPGDHPEFRKVVKLATGGNFDAIPGLVDNVKKVDDFVHSSPDSRFHIDGESFFFDGVEMHGTLAERMVSMALEGLDITAMQNFMINLMENQSYRSVNELYSFLEAGKLPITPDGHFLAYKLVRSDYKDIYSGTMDNSVGAVVTMPRNEVDEDSERTCSHGLHFCSYDYLPHFGTGRGDRCMVVKLNPRDVVAIPADYNDTKGRACRYEVVRELESYHSDRIEGTVSVDGSKAERVEDDSDEVYLPDEMKDATGFLIAVSYEMDDYEDDYEDDEDYEGDDTDEDETTIEAFDMRSGTTTFYDSVEHANAGTNVPVEYINRVLRGHRGSSLGYAFIER